jgi:MFS family permease
VLGGAFVAAAIAFLLMALGAGMGLSSISPWPRAGLSVSRVAPGAIVWIVLVQLLSSALGGYLAGRLRTKWVSLHTHEVYFRDTAHGLLVWAVSLVLGVAFLSSLATSMAKDFAETDKDGQASGVSYYVDSLFRATDPNLVPRDPALREEVSLILIKALRDPAIGAQDRTYIARLISARTGLTTAEASRRLDETIASARDAVDRARKAVAHSLYWLVVALLIGAFSGSFAATIGGRQRDSVETV